MEELTTQVSEIAVSLDTLWVLIAAAMVMFMQPGFAMVESGFTRAKNTVNILMKNVLDFSVGSLIFWLIGFSIMFGTDLGGFIGMPDLFFSGNYGNDVDPAMLIFQTVFAATAATIVSGAVAERTEFSGYVVASFFITALIYPISGHWVWGGGWLSELGFHDFAGSTVVHSVGGWLGLMGAAIVGPRLGKYNGKRKAIPGHSMTIGALGVFILWFGWFGFNPGSQLAASGLDNISAVASIFVTTNLSAAAGTVTAMIISKVRYKRPSLGLSLNGALAGLVAITAGCNIVSPGGAVIIGIVAGFVLIFGVELLDKMKIDDPVGAVTVHGFSGAVGTLMVGLLATEGGLFYGDGASLLGVQALGVVSIAAWALAMGFILFRTIKATIGLRVPKRVEEEGLDIYEHGESAYDTMG
ncbi:MAG: ammonium transporter [Marinilabiliaceae bacterium]